MQESESSCPDFPEDVAREGDQSLLPLGILLASMPSSPATSAPMNDRVYTFTGGESGQWIVSEIRL